MVEQKRIELIEDVIVDSPIARFRSGLQNIMVKNAQRRMRKGGGGGHIRSWTFPDAIKSSEDALPLPDLTLAERLAVVRACEEAHANLKAVKTLFNTASKLTAAKVDKSSDAPLERNVAIALKALKEVCPYCCTSMHFILMLRTAINLI